LEAARRVVALAVSMRLPHGRHGAWSKHLQLLEVASELLGPALPWLDEVDGADARAMLDRIRGLTARRRSS
jgi:hypothetical protein